MQKEKNYPKILLINKPIHWTSNDVIRKIKNKYKIKKIGHAGTLDPLATGLLILGINDGTKLINNIVNDTKIYEAIIHFNYSTNTYDNEGSVINFKYRSINLNEIVNVLNEMTNNDYWQIPPIYSAIKINGKKSYELARNNKEVHLKPRLVKLFNYKIIYYKDNELKIQIKTSKGFYVRSFAYDLGLKLNNFGNLAKLTRLEIGTYKLFDAYKLDELDDILNK